MLCDELLSEKYLGLPPTQHPDGHGLLRIAVSLTPHRTKLLPDQPSPPRFLIPSYVHRSSPVLGRGWLSAAGDFGAAGEAETKLHFDRFWVDRGEEPLRDNLNEGRLG